MVGRDAEQHCDADVPDRESRGSQDDEAVDFLAACVAASQCKLNAGEEQNDPKQRRGKHLEDRDDGG